MHRKGKNTILCVFVWFKTPNLQLCKSCSVRAKMAACEIRLCFVWFCGFLTFHSFEINFDRPKTLVFVHNLEEKDQNFYLTCFITLFSAAKSVLSCSRAVTASKLWCVGKSVIVLTDPIQKQIISGDKAPEKWGSKVYFPYWSQFRSLFQLLKILQVKSLEWMPIAGFIRELMDVLWS